MIRGNIYCFGWEVEEYPRQFAKEPKAITESFSPSIPCLGFCTKKTKENFSVRIAIKPWWYRSKYIINKPLLGTPKGNTKNIDIRVS